MRFDPVRDAAREAQERSQEPGQVVRRCDLEGSPNVIFYQLKWCPFYAELKKQALTEADSTIKEWAQDRRYDSFAQAFRLELGSFGHVPNEINIFTPAHYQPIPPQTRVGVYPIDDPNAVQDIEWREKSYILKEDECITVLYGKIELLITRVFFTGKPAISTSEAVTKADLPAIAPTDSVNAVPTTTSTGELSMVSPLTNRMGT